MKITKRILQNNINWDVFENCWYCFGDHYRSKNRSRVTGIKRGYYPRCYFKQYFL